MSYDICLFDLDGTLTDPWLGITKSFQYALAAFGIHEEIGHLKKFIGPSLREFFKENYSFSETDIEKAVIKYREYFAEKGLYENEVYPGIPELLQKLKNDGKKMAVVTNKAAFYADIILKHFNLERFFIYLSGDNFEGTLTKNGKRDLVNIALDKIDPKRKLSAVMIGDRKHDIIGANETGIDSIGVMWGYGSRNELETAGAKWIVDSVDGLYRLVEGKNE